jgi:hypothetical protein
MWPPGQQQRQQPDRDSQSFAMISFSASGETRRCFGKIGLHCRKFHHAFLSTMQSCIVCEARRIAVNLAKLPELLAA